MPDPRRKTIAKHLEEKTFRPDRHAGKASPIIVETLPKPPASLDKRVHKIWYEQAKGVLSLRLLSEKDYTALETLCFLLWVQKEAQNDILANGITFISDKGAIQRNPSLTTLEKVSSQILQLQKEFGQTPLAAQRIDAPPEPEGEGDPRNNLFGAASKN